MSMNSWPIMEYPYNEFYSGMKGNELLIHATWMNLNYAKWKKAGEKEYILYDSMITFGNVN